MSPLELSLEVCEAMFAEASAVFPREACGVVVGQVGVPAQQRFVRFLFVFFFSRFFLFFTDEYHSSTKRRRRDDDQKSNGGVFLL